MIHIKTAQEIAIMAEGGKLLAQIMNELEKMIRPGISSKEIDIVAETLILKSGNKCSFKGYRGSDSEFSIPFPTCICVSVNSQIVHCIPSGRILKQGDIISLDIGLVHKGFHSDMAKTFAVGNITNEAKNLILATKESLELAIEKTRIGNTLGDIGHTIEKYIESKGFSVVRNLCGHGIGKNLHEDPLILNYGKSGVGSKIEEGMILCIEPIIAMGDWQSKGADDGFGYETEDGSLSAHFEHTIAVTKNGPQVLTIC